MADFRYLKSFILKGELEHLPDELKASLAAIQRELSKREDPEVPVSKTNFWRSKDAAAYAAKLRAALGEPNPEDYYHQESSVCWKGLGGLLSLRVDDMSLPYDVPAPHRVFVEACIGLRVPPEIVGLISGVTAAIQVDGLRGTVSAKADTLVHCVVALGWVEDLVNGAAKAEEYSSRIAGDVTPAWFPASMKGIDVPVALPQAPQILQAETVEAPKIAEEPVEMSKGVPSDELEPGNYDVEMYFPIGKVDDEERLVTGIVLEPDEVDSQSDTISAETIKGAAHKFLSGYNHKTKMGLMHKVFGKIGVELAESWIAREDGKLGGEAVKAGSWLMTIKVTDDNLWRKVKTGAITGFSIGGIATVA